MAGIGAELSCVEARLRAGKVRCRLLADSSVAGFGRKRRIKRVN